MKPILDKKNKKGAIGMIFFFIILFLILILGFIAVMSVSIIDYASDTVTPIMTELGVVGDTNLSQAGEITFGTADTFIQAMPWLLGFVYVCALMFSVIFAISYSVNPHPVFIGFYLMLVVLLIFGSIVMSNMYEEIYTGTDEIATRLQENTIMSYMILYSPFILTLISLLTGIYMFAKPSVEGGSGI